MQLLTQTDYALRALIYVASHASAPVPASEIARAFDISEDHVAKTTKALTRAGYLRSTRGAHGGVQLAKKASAIRVGAVVRLFEMGRGPVACLTADAPRCKIEQSCRLRAAIQRAEDAFLAELDAFTLEDVIENANALVQILRSPSR